MSILNITSCILQNYLYSRIFSCFHATNNHLYFIKILVVDQHKLVHSNNNKAERKGCIVFQHSFLKSKIKNLKSTVCISLIPDTSNKTKNPEQLLPSDTTRLLNIPPACNLISV